MPVDFTRLHDATSWKTVLCLRLACLLVALTLDPEGGGSPFVRNTGNFRHVTQYHVLENGTVC
jgi:hypothetical protein